MTMGSTAVAVHSIYTGISSSNSDDVLQKQPLMEEDEQRSILKLKLKSLLAKHNGCTKHPDVEQVITDLSELNPSNDGKHDHTILDSPHFLGDFTALTSPNFPGRLENSKDLEDDVIQYTLGRLSFNIFQPQKLVCTLRGVRNPVAVLTDSKHHNNDDGKTLYTYPLLLDITIHTDDGDLPACLQNEAYCYEHGSDTPGRLSVSFTGGTLLPTVEVTQNPETLALWTKTFEHAYQRANEERSVASSMVQYLMSAMMGLTLPTDHNEHEEHDNNTRFEHSFHFEMKRSPIGYLDVLYLDHEFRITRGNRGTIVVVERTDHP